MVIIGSIIQWSQSVPYLILLQSKFTVHSYDDIGNWKNKNNKTRDESVVGCCVTAEGSGWFDFKVTAKEFRRTLIVATTW